MSYLLFGLCITHTIRCNLEQKNYEFMKDKKWRALVNTNLQFPLKAGNFLTR